MGGGWAQAVSGHYPISPETVVWGWGGGRPLLVTLGAATSVQGEEALQDKWGRLSFTRYRHYLIESSVPDVLLLLPDRTAGSPRSAARRGGAGTPAQQTGTLMHLPSNPSTGLFFQVPACRELMRVQEVSLGAAQWPLPCPAGVQGVLTGH